MKGRERQRANRRKKHQEEALDRYNSWGYKDLTPYDAVKNLRSDNKSKQEKVV